MEDKITRNLQITEHHTHQHLWELFRETYLVTGPFSFLNPTRAHFHHLRQHDHEELAENVELQWRSRDNRKGRHTLFVKPATSPDAAIFVTPESTASVRGVMKGIARMFTQYPYYDVSWLVAVIFTLGSVVWCINGFFSFLPLVRPSSEFATETAYGGGTTAFIGATIFEIGSILLMVEAVNENRTGCFGWAVETILEGEKGGLLRLRPDQDGCKHHHQNKKNLVGERSVSRASKASDSGNAASSDSNESDDRRNWVWFPSWHDLTSHYFREIGFLACLSQTIGATVFWISGFTALPKVIDMTNKSLTDGVFWTPQVIGGTGFVISGLLFMLETQKKWYLPAWETLGWHIGLWNLIGALGFTVCFVTKIIRYRYAHIVFEALWRFWLLFKQWTPVPSSVLYILG